MWLLLIRPQRRKQQEQQDLLSNLQIGDEIVTAGGIYGTISEVEDGDVTVEIAPGTNVRMAKRAVAAILTDEEEEEEESTTRRTKSPRTRRTRKSIRSPSRT